jgi:hypothetical protein
MRLARAAFAVRNASRNDLGVPSGQSKDRHSSRMESPEEGDAGAGRMPRIRIRLNSNFLPEVEQDSRQRTGGARS